MFPPAVVKLDIEITTGHLKNNASGDSTKCLVKVKRLKPLLRRSDDEYKPSQKYL
jgi:hypothetical protein